MSERCRKLFVIACLLVASRLVSAETPEWLRALARQPSPPYPPDVNAVVLLDEIELTVSDNGDQLEHGRIAYRILRPDGRDVAVFAVSYNNDMKMRSLHGWSITSKGQEYEAKDKDAYEMSLTTFELFSDM